MSTPGLTRLNCTSNPLWSSHMYKATYCIFSFGIWLWSLCFVILINGPGWLCWSIRDSQMYVLEGCQSLCWATVTERLQERIHNDKKTTVFPHCRNSEEAILLEQLSFLIAEMLKRLIHYVCYKERQFFLIIMNTLL